MKSIHVRFTPLLWWKYLIPECGIKGYKTSWGGVWNYYFWLCFTFWVRVK